MLSLACPARSAHLDSVPPHHHPASHTAARGKTLYSKQHERNSITCRNGYRSKFLCVCVCVCWGWGVGVTCECMQMVLMPRCVDEVWPRLDFLCPRAPSWIHQSRLVGHGYDCVCPRVCTFNVSLGIFSFEFYARLHHVCLKKKGNVLAFIF